MEIKEIASLVTMTGIYIGYSAMFIVWVLMLIKILFYSEDK